MTVASYFVGDVNLEFSQEQDEAWLAMALLLITWFITFCGLGSAVMINSDIPKSL
jgi:hypothetical protein